MESLSDTNWDVVISGTGLQQSLLALALSRSGKNILHVDPNEFYGSAEAALSLQDAEEWAEKYSGRDDDEAFAGAQVTKDNESIASPRSYALALAPQLIHAKSELLTQLVASKAFRQIEFLAVGSFFIYQKASDSGSKPTLSRIPSTREDVFANTAIPARSKRSLMKFLKFVLDYESEPQVDLWKAKANEPLSEFLATEFKLDGNLQSYVVTLTLSPDGKITVGAGLAAINRHLTSMGVFGAGFAAVYPKWGGLSEVAQVGCRASAVGGAIYMLGVGISYVQNTPSEDEDLLDVSLANGVTVKSKKLIRDVQPSGGNTVRVSRLTAVVNSALPDLFKAVVEGAPTPCVAVVAFPAGSVTGEDGFSAEFPIYALVHSSDTGECPSGQCTINLSTPASSQSMALLDAALSSFLDSVSSDGESPKSIWCLRYDQAIGSGSLTIDRNIGTFDPLPPDLAFNDSVLAPVQQAWNIVVGISDNTEEYMKFEDREGADDDDDKFNC